MGTIKEKKLSLKKLSKIKEKKTIGTGDGGLITKRIKGTIKKSS